MKKKLLLLLLFPSCTHSVDWLNLCITLEKFGLGFLASEMFTESGDHFGPLPEKIPEPTGKEKRQLMTAAAMKRQEEEAHKKLEAYLKAETARQQQDPEYVKDFYFREMSGEEPPSITSFELQDLSSDKQKQA